MENEEINIHELYKASSGQAKDKTPNAVAQFSRIKQGNPPTVERDVLLDGATLYFHVFAGCAVIKAVMPPTSRFAWQSAKVLYEDWLKSQEEEGAPLECAIMTVFPVFMEGTLFPQFTTLVYAEFYEGEKGMLHAIFCYDNATSMIYTAEGIDIKAINAEIDAEYMRQEEELDNQIEDLEKEERRLDNEITKARYGDFAKTELNDIDTIIDSKKTDNDSSFKSHSGLRFGGDDNESLK